MVNTIPQSLRLWFQIHFVVDSLLALPLFIAPQWTLSLFGFTVINPMLARLVAAALLAIGTTSLFVSRQQKEQFETLLTLKIIWSITAIIGILWSMAEDGTPPSLWLFVGLFGMFSAVWIYYKRMI